MSWVKTSSASVNDLGNQATKSVAAGAAVAVGDLICVGATIGQNFGPPPDNGVVTDSLGNTYTRVASAAHSSNHQIVEVHYCIVTVSGTPTVTIRYNPTPGTTQATNVSMNVDTFTGSDASSTADGTGAAQEQSGLGGTTDAVTSGSWTTTTNGDLIYAATCQTDTGNDPGSVGTGFTLAQNSGGVILKTEYRTQTTAGSVAGTFTGGGSFNNFVTAAMAIKPAAAVVGVGEPWQKHGAMGVQLAA